jgi:hypothetical protein
MRHENTAPRDVSTAPGAVLPKAARRSVGATGHDAAGRLIDDPALPLAALRARLDDVLVAGLRLEGELDRLALAAQRRVGRGDNVPAGAELGRLLSGGSWPSIVCSTTRASMMTPSPCACGGAVASGACRDSRDNAEQASLGVNTY